MNKHPIERLVAIMAKLRDPENGCPWDREQTWLSLLEHTIEEAYEVADAIEQGHDDEVPNELGDLLFQVVFYSQIAREEGKFSLEDVIERLSDKLERRHPHVFGEISLERHQLDEVWHKTKAAERKEKSLHSVLDDIPLALPALTRAQKLQRRAANEGFDWPDYHGVLDKLDEEILELRQAIDNNDQDNIEEEIGDLLFTIVNLSRHHQQDAETSLRRSSAKFEARYRKMEALMQDDGVAMSDLSNEQMDAYWRRVKTKQ
jgi:ATP diphosphatase